MKCLNGSQGGLMLIGFVAAIVLGGGRIANADFTFGEPTNPGSPVNTSGSDGTPYISPDGLSLYFTSNRSGGSGAHDLWMVTRSSINDNWSSPVNLGPKVNSSSMDYFPCMSAEGLSIYFYSTRAGGRGGGDIWVANRSSIDAPWDNAVNMGPTINGPSEDVSPNISHDGLSLIFASDRPGGRGDYDLYISNRASVDSAWSAPRNLGPTINTPFLDVAPSLSSDGLVLFFHSIRSGGFGSYDIYYSRRQSLSSEWSAPVNLGPPVNSSYSELGPAISGDGLSLYFSDHYIYPPKPGGLGIDDIWQASITPIVDFNGDGKVNISDLVILIEHWGKNEPMLDIAPGPFGDGVLDEEDLDVLMSYWGQEVKDLTLVAHWKMDETGGIVVQDSSGEYNGTLQPYGGPKWQPDGGMVDGAIELDGIDDYIITPFIPNLTDGPFSLFAWIKGDTPGRTIISQKGRVNWLVASSPDGTLATELKRQPPYYRPMSSDAVITDGNWHRVGLVWDGTNIMLCVDGMEVASDALTTFSSSEEDIYIGAGNNLAAGSFFSGLIDDVRIYNRIVAP